MANSSINKPDSDNQTPAQKAGVNISSNNNPSKTLDTSENQKNLNDLFFIVYGEPVALGRHRTSTKGGRIRNYTPQKSVDAKEHIAAMVRSQYKGAPVINPIKLYLNFYFQAPKALIRKQADGVMREVIPHTKRPDATNLTKLVEDALNGILWADDSQIHEISVSKVYSNIPRTSFFMQVLP